METNNSSKTQNTDFKNAVSSELSLSEYFKKKRQEKKLTIKVLSQKTGISTRNLEKIESGEWASLPAQIYVRDFLSKCAAVFLEDEKTLLELYEREIAWKKNDAQNALSGVSKRSFIVTPKIVIKVLFAAFILAILAYFVFQLNYLLGSPKLIAVTPESDIITRTKEVDVSGSTQPDNKVTINDNDVFVDSSGFFLQTVPLQSGINTIKIKATNRLNKESVVIRRVILEE